MTDSNDTSDGPIDPLSASQIDALVRSVPKDSPAHEDHSGKATSKSPSSTTVAVYAITCSLMMCGGVALVFSPFFMPGPDSSSGDVLGIAWLGQTFIRVLIGIAILVATSIVAMIGGIIGLSRSKK
ncbi:MAG: hypothetical protein ACR2NZ_14610 [Rubripirellula sp.]